MPAPSEHLFNPQVGDCWHEMYSYWEFIVELPDDGSVVVMHTSGDASGDPIYAELKRRHPNSTVVPDMLFETVYPTLDAWQDHLSYKSIPGTWAQWHSTKDVTDWRQERAAARERVAADLMKNRMRK